jgi:hypothetical protein
MNRCSGWSEGMDRSESEYLMIVDFKLFYLLTIF